MEGQDKGEGNNAGDKNELLDSIDHTYVVESLTIIRVKFRRLDVHSR